ncbi:hypothetical protein HID58_007912 [Brassica napus]|uniref:Uncharacterized protein n=1 Tax=Brassica napus TaxID=3708 RepID=A0ABQ7XI43_BRANA|nr:uncharacterized protein LOC125593957 [Brassica napus]KAH0855556.1 hypothetical protein HID58_007912 [Brassica napus]
MPGSHGEITVVEQNRVDNDNKKTRKKKEEDDSENGNQLVKPLISKPRKQFTDRFRRNTNHVMGRVKEDAFLDETSQKRGGGGGGRGSPSSSARDMLRVMLENNDYFSDECNPHR